MPTRTTCPHCKVAITFLDAQVGTSLTCPRCSVSWVFTATEDSGNESRNSPAGNRDSAYKIACPKCSAVTKLPQATGGHLMTCKRCAAQVVLPHPTNVHKAVASSAVETECTRCSRCYTIAAQGQFEWTECPGCGVVSVARPMGTGRTQPLPPPLPTSALVTNSQPATAIAPPSNQGPSPNATQSRRVSRWVVTLVLLACLTGAVLIGVSLRDAGQAKPWTTTGRGEGKATSHRSTTGRIEEKAITGRDLVTFLKECGAVKNHVVIPSNEIVREFRLPATKAWGLMTNRGVVVLFEFEEEVDARVSPIWGCQIGSVRLALVEASDGNIWSYCAALGVLLSPEADARFTFSDETKTRLRNEFNRVERSIRKSAEAQRAIEDKVRRWEAEMNKNAERMREEMEKRMERK